MSYEFNKNDAYEFAQVNGASTREKQSDHGAELEFMYCPMCKGGQHRDTYTFSINLESGAFLCQRGKCGYKGHFVELCRDFGFKLEFAQPVHYVRLPQPVKPMKPTETVYKYLENRGISREIAERYEIAQSSKRHPVIRSDGSRLKEIGNRANVMAIPFYDQDGVLKFVKFRDMDYKSGDPVHGSKEWTLKDAEPVLFGMNKADQYDKPLVITEGQIDALSLVVAGIPNACSVPMGMNNFRWVQPALEWIRKFPEVIVFGDCENGHITLIDELRSRMPGIPIKYVPIICYLGEKDANDILRKYGADALRKAVDGATVPVVRNVKSLSDVKDVDINSISKIRTGIKGIDALIKGLCVGQVILVSGKRGDGKSTFVSQLTANALAQDKNVFVYSGELATSHTKRWLNFQLAGFDHFDEPGYEPGTVTINREVVQRINDWYRGKAWIYDNQYLPDDRSELVSLTDTIEQAIREYDINLVVVDNLMTAMEEVHDRDNLYIAQSNFVGRLKKIAMQYNVVVILVAHPRKSNGTFDNDTVSGSGDITNKVDIVMNYKKGTDNPENANEILSYVEITKNRLFGTLTKENEPIKLMYHKQSKRIYSADSKESIYRYGWEAKPAETFEPVDDDDIPF